MTTLITDVRVFDGRSALAGRHDVALDATGIHSVEPGGSADAEAVRSGGGTVIDGARKTLLPGLIDDHVHFDSLDQLMVFARWGVTTVLDMATFSTDFIAQLRAATEGADLRTAGVPIVSAHGNHAKIPVFPRESITDDADRACELVRKRVEQGMDYIKIVLEAPGRGGLAPEVARAVVEEAHGAGKMVVAHAVSVGAYRIGVEAGVDVLIHSPLDAEMPEDLVAGMVEQSIVSSPAPAAGEVLIDVEAVGLPRVVRARAAGKHYSVSGQFPSVPGIDGVGVTPEGQRVWFFTMGSETNGSPAEKVVVDPALTVPVPAGMDPVDVAASVNPFMAAWMSVFPRGELKQGEHLVVLGATGASGRATLQVARGTAGRATAVGRNREVLDGLVAEGLADDVVALDSEEEAERWADVAGTANLAVDYRRGPVAERFWAAVDRAAVAGRSLRHVEVGTMSGADATLPGSVLRGTDLRLLGSAPGAYT